MPAAQKGDLVILQDCLSKKANIEAKNVRNAFLCKIGFKPACCCCYVVREPFEGCQIRSGCDFLFSCGAFFLEGIERVNKGAKGARVGVVIF